ncbi:hypothetical protein FQA39_LY14563 [Lamprigera yunnana]|nr:hypothetical protein FQA39_LY14563 [Lamprigera yunnana]
MLASYTQQSLKVSLNIYHFVLIVCALQIFKNLCTDHSKYIMERSSFAVVCFLKDKSYSKVPINWLNAEKTQCWCPKMKNPYYFKFLDFLEENTMPLPRVYKSTVPNDEIFENVLGIVNINNLPVLVNTDEVSAEVNNVSNQISDAIGSTSFVSTFNTLLLINFIQLIMTESSKEQTVLQSIVYGGHNGKIFVIYFEVGTVIFFCLLICYVIMDILDELGKWTVPADSPWMFTLMFNANEKKNVVPSSEPTSVI